MLHLFLFVAIVWLLAFRWSDPRWCAVAGIALGLALLAKSLLLPFVPVLLLAPALGGRVRDALPRLALVVACALLIMAPCVGSKAARNDEPLIANSALFNLWVGLNDVGRESFTHDVVWPEYLAWRTSAPTHAERQRILRRSIATLIAERGLGRVLTEQLSRQYFRLFDAGCYLTDQLPGGAAYEAAGKGYQAVGPRLGRALRAITVASIVLLLVAAPVGLAVGACRRHRWVRVLLLFVAYNLLLFLWVHVKTRDYVVRQEMLLGAHALIVRQLVAETLFVLAALAVLAFALA